ncbi:putative bifunctional diguanylate cyclase/phosphodiesterase [Propionivibrio limicola]|uniref:putative bifunctional diguanylate cyclase/phosphodiesterase n=1 Tax=Propionivibrio limicola TaxID=167645 RepID=UPI00129259FD|nr:GGDEF and EAL domain-containing protein [Propionivibrio limicola]
MEILAHTRYTKRLMLLTTTVAVLVTFILLMTYQYVSGLQQLEEELEAQAAILGTNSAAALAFNDQKAAYENLTAIRKTARILGAALYETDGNLFILIDDPESIFPDSINPLELDTPPRPRVDTGLFTRLLRVEVMQAGVRVGSLVLLATYRPLYTNLLIYAVGLVLIGLVALILSRRFTARLRKKMAITEGELEKMALYDRVTGLPNRRFFEYELKKAVNRIQREEENAALLMIDVDDFKKVNDLCGHATGDDVLQMIANRLKQTIRADDVLARIGGDEFAAILFRPGDPENVNAIAGKMIEVISRPFPTEPIPSHVGLSIGMTMMPNDSDDPTTLLRWSDMAMYEAKSQGKNRAQFFSAEINRKIRSDLQIEAGLREAIRTDAPETGLYLAYQPQVCARTRQIVGFEALMRWIPPGGEFVSPAEFIPVAEKSGLIVDIGAWVIRRACQDIAALRQQGINIPKMAINVSPREMTRGNALVENACKTLLHFGECAQRIEFEITENALMAENGADVLTAFRNAGFTLAIDDFGTGYSSLGYLRRFQVGALKIDQQFVHRLPDNSEDAAIVSAVIQMAKALGITVVAEGVETEAQAEFLTAHGCDILQGYLISRPLPLAELVTFIHNHAPGTMESPCD